ncbi:MAG: NAD(P)H-binding protein, partial [Bdellovibrio sp.]|nr:NAD(P)H-binding protein [Bdellovibrio sp.]
MIAVTGATGNLGKLVIAELLQRGVNPQNIVALVRNRGKAEEFESQGINVREADYT